MPNSYTPKDYRLARALGVSLDDAPDGHDAALDRLYNTLTTAYQRLDCECAHVHCAERDVRAERDSYRKWAHRLIWLLAGAVFVAAGEVWRIWR